MALDQINVIDAIGIDKISEEVILTISDQFDWSEAINEHFFYGKKK